MELPSVIISGMEPNASRFPLFCCIPLPPLQSNNTAVLIRSTDVIVFTLVAIYAATL